MTWTLSGSSENQKWYVDYAETPRHVAYWSLEGRDGLSSEGISSHQLGHRRGSLFHYDREAVVMPKWVYTSSEVIA